MSEIHHKSKFREFIQLFRHLDILATPYEFNVCESSQSQNVVAFFFYFLLKGGIISLCLVIAMILYSITIYLKNSNQSLLYQGTQSEQEIKYTLNQDSALFALEISKYKTGEMISFDSQLNQYLNVAVQYVNQIRHDGVYGYQRQKTKLNGNRCSEDKFKEFNFNSGTFAAIQKQNLICYDGDYQILGQFYDQQFSYIDISVSACTNTTSYNQCKSADEILQFINQGINIDIFLTGMRVKKYLNISNPVDTYPVNYFWRLAPTIGNSQDIYLQPITIELGQYELLTQLGQDAKNKQIFQSSVVSQVDSRYTSVDITSGASLSSFYLRLSTDSQYYFSIQQSTFPLILQAISQAAGLMMAILGACKIVYKIYATHKTFETIMNRVFKFDLSKHQTSYEQEDPNDPPNPIKNLYNYKLKFFFWDFIWMRICKFFMRFDTTKKYANRCVSKDKQVQLAYMAQKKILKDLDLANIVQKLYEIDFLKLYLLKPDQLLLFNSFSHPVLNDQVVQSVNNLKSNKKQLDRNSGMKNSEVKKGVVQAVESSIPIEDILSQYSQFFQAQMRAETSGMLVEAYAKFKNSGHKEKLKHQFDQYLMRNRALYQFLKKSSEPGMVQSPQVQKKITQKKIVKSIYSESRDQNEKSAPEQNNPLIIHNSSSSDEEPSPSGNAVIQEIENQDEVKIILEVNEDQENEGSQKK